MPAGSRARTVVAWFTASRLAIAALGVIGVATFATFTDQGTTVMNTTAALDPSNVWHKWDALWYERVALHGYAYELDTPQGQAAAGFFPLYPLTIRLILRLIPALPFFWVATAVSNLATLAALLLLAQNLVPRDGVVGRVMAIFMTSAGSFYLSIPYTEGLFLLLVVGTLIATRRRRYALAGLLAGLGATTRVHGLALVAVPLVACWLDAALAPRSRWTRAAAALGLFAAPVVVYLAALAAVQGSWMAFVARQDMWSNPSPYPFQAVLGLLHFPTRISGWLHGAFWMLYVGLLVRYWRRMPPGEAWFCAGVLVITTQQEAFHGVYRYMVPLVPLTLALAEDRDRVRSTLIAINLVFGVLMILAFVTHNRLAV
jgi:hypothetical protein